MRALAGLLVLAVGLLSGCEAVPLETTNPAAVPSGTLEARGATADGPVVELGTGSSAGIGWRYSIFESDDGWCTQLETQAVTSTHTACGETSPGEDGAFGFVTRNGTIVDGVVSADTATVWLVAEGGLRVTFATLMPLEDAGLEGQAFVGITEAGTELTHVMAVKLNGEILETRELP